MSRRALLALVLIVAASCGPTNFELVRVQRSDVKVEPSDGGHLNPLTGIRFYSDAAWTTRPALAVKIGNSSAERPQAGLEQADLVYEELVEGGFTRFIAVFLTKGADRVGPVRSARIPDPSILASLDPLLAYSGGVNQVVSAVRAAVTDVGAFRKADAYVRDGSRQAPYNLYTSTRTLWEDEEGEPPEPAFEFLESDDDITEGGQPATEASMAFAGNATTIRYEYVEESGRYARYLGSVPHTFEAPTASPDGDPVPTSARQLSFRNVLIQKVDTRPGPYTDVNGAPVTDLVLNGSGEAALLRGGRIFRGTWSRSDRDEPTTFTDDDGHPLELAPGETIVELLPSDRDFSTF